VQGEQKRPEQIFPPLQSPAVRQSPATQAPASQTCPAPHCALAVHVPQTLLTQPLPEAQSGALRQSATVQTPERQSLPALHCPSAVQVVQVFVCASQRGVAGQVELSMQFPGLHKPPAQTRPLPHCALEPQLTQAWLALHSWPEGQSFSARHTPGVHAPDAQT